MAFKVLFCILVISGQSFAGASSCGCSQDFGPPVYSSDGIAFSEISYQPSYKPISISLTEKEYQSSYKPVCKESFKSSSKPIYISVSEKESHQSYKPISVSSLDVPNNGGAFLVTSVGSIVPFGIGVASDLSLGGELEVSGVVPYLSAVTFEGQFDANGVAAVGYGCGDCVAITEEIRGSPSYNPLGTW